MNTRIGWFSVLLTFLIISLLACNEKEEPFDTQYLPNGVSRSDYQLFLPHQPTVDEPKVHPPHWWVNMQHDTIQLLIHDTSISAFSIQSSSPSLQIINTHRLDNPNYLVIELHIEQEIIPKTYEFTASNEAESRKYAFEIKSKPENIDFIDPLNSSDRIYLIMPDRFSNGDKTNDKIPDMMQKEIDRSKMYFRHGGDIQGIIVHLDYIKALGFTSIWLTPVIENDQPYSSYHGYALTDHYSVDPRFGGNNSYKKLSEECQKNGIKLIMDVVPNHVGDHHWFVRDIPSKDWIHQSEAYLSNNHSHESTIDPSSSAAKMDSFLRGWFDYSMPDLNQRNPYLSKYLIQNSIWWIQEMGIDGFRIDTYGYSYPDFTSEWASAIKKEFPDFFLFGETWMPTVEFQHAILNGNYNDKKLNTHLNGITDFQFSEALIHMLANDDDNDNGLIHMKDILSKDSIYENVENNVVCLDNHDMHRFYSVVGEDITRFKAGFTLLYTLRGLPVVYYGSEILHKNFKDPDGKVRSDFFGGWPEDNSNKFESQHRTKKENEILNHITKLNELRKHYNAFHNFQLIINKLESNLFIAYQKSEDQCILIIFNPSQSKIKYDFTNDPQLSVFEKAQELLTGKSLSSTINLKPGEAKLILFE
jgi:glycosidase